MRRFLYFLFRLYLRVRRPLMMGSRVIVIKEDKVLLVRMTYVNDWYLPGGGVARGETYRAAAVRELREECGIEADNAELFNIFLSRKEGKVDHVAVFVIDRFKEISDAPKDPEIREMGFFALDQLPDGTSPATRRRIEEFRQNRRDVEIW